MDIRCERCATEYEIEDSRIPASGLTIKCATCAHFFKVLPGIAPPPPAYALRMNRDGSDLAAACPDTATLQRWIVEQRILQSDEVSVAGAPWRKLGDLLELAPFFALLSMPPPVAKTPTYGTPIQPAGPTNLPPPHARAPAANPAPTLLSTPALRPPPAAPPVFASAPPPAEEARTIQIQMTPDMFGAPAPAPTLASPPVPAPFTSPPPSAPMTGTAWPSLPEGLGQGLQLESFGGTPTTQPSAPKPQPEIPTAPSTPRASPVARPNGATVAPAPAPLTRAPLPPTRPPPVRPAPAAKPAPAQTKPPPARPAPRKVESDPDLDAFMQKRRNTRVTLLALVFVVVIALAAFVFYPQITERVSPRGPSPAAGADYANGRKLYLTDTPAEFQAAETAYKEAIATEHGVFPKAAGAMAELHAAWAEALLNHYNVLRAQMEAMVKAGKDGQSILPQVNDTAMSQKEKLDLVFKEASELRKAREASVEEDRAVLDYYRLAGDAKKAAGAAEALRSHTDPETLAHIAIWEASDPSKLADAEKTLKSVVSQMPEFIRARVWLAQVHVLQGDTAAATADMEAILAAEPQHEGAKDFLDAQKAAAAPAGNAPPPATGEQPVAANTPPPGTEATALAAPPRETPKPQTGNLPRKPREPPPGKETPVETVSMPASGPVNVERMIDEAGRQLGHGKYDKALAVYEKVLTVRPTLSDALYGKGLALYDMGRLMDAITAFKRTLQVNPRFGDAMIGAAEALKKENNKAEAAKFYQQYVDMYPSGDQAAAARANINALK